MAGRKAGTVGNAYFSRENFFRVLDGCFKLRLAEKPHMRSADNGMDGFSRQRATDVIQDINDRRSERSQV